MRFSQHPSIRPAQKVGTRRGKGAPGSPRLVGHEGAPLPSSEHTAHPAPAVGAPCCGPGIGLRRSRARLQTTCLNNNCSSPALSRLSSSRSPRRAGTGARQQGPPCGSASSRRVDLLLGSSRLPGPTAPSTLHASSASLPQQDDATASSAKQSAFHGGAGGAGASSALSLRLASRRLASPAHASPWRLGPAGKCSTEHLSLPLFLHGHDATRTAQRRARRGQLQPATPSQRGHHCAHFPKQHQSRALWWAGTADIHAPATGRRAPRRR